ncbi:hypothetical protein WS61_07575 [Burkholderia sp. ABCPW 11]|uniref:hypothetical protein n=1 Tax=Burkholderia sp. ABCPW 11 TaxID=1637859 RepID=UPI0007577B84|nr:hypothetical protein [Burkholderia sp. ABCPW 11]KVD48668.1 hypothetical protein WS61_07575 [Burkholderia sp. ABCPW 11]
MEREIDRGGHVVGACVAPEPEMDGAVECAVEVGQLAIVAMAAAQTVTLRTARGDAIAGGRRVRGNVVSMRQRGCVENG